MGDTVNLTELFDGASADLATAAEGRDGSRVFSDLVASLDEIKMCLRVGAVNATMAMLGRAVESSLLLHLEDNEIVIPNARPTLHTLIELAKPTLSGEDERLLWSLTDNLRIVRNQAVHAIVPARTISRTELGIALCTVLLWLEREYRNHADSIVPEPEAQRLNALQTSETPEPDLETCDELVLFVRSPEATADGLSPKESYDMARDAWRVSDARAELVRIVGVVDRNGVLHSAYRVTRWLIKPGASRKVFEGERARNIEEFFRTAGLPSIEWGQNPMRYVHVKIPASIASRGGQS